MTYIITHSGTRFEMDTPVAALVSLEDIAWHLSQLCRFTGATRFPYSVAQHSYYVYRELKRRKHDVATQLHGLFHDAHEAYCADLSRPVADMVCMETGIYYALCDRIQLVIEQQLGIAELWPDLDAIAILDQSVGYAEALQLVDPAREKWNYDGQPAPIRITKWSTERAYNTFLYTAQGILAQLQPA
jgi:uncharacterized protein